MSGCTWTQVPLAPMPTKEAVWSLPPTPEIKLLLAPVPEGASLVPLERHQRNLLAFISVFIVSLSLLDIALLWEV